MRELISSEYLALANEASQVQTPKVMQEVPGREEQQQAEHRIGADCIGTTRALEEEVERDVEIRRE